MIAFGIDDERKRHTNIMLELKGNGHDHEASARLLVVEDVEEIRDVLVKLLKTDGYRVDPARDEEEAIDKARCNPPGLILISLGEVQSKVIAAAARIRERAGLTENVPVVVFCADTIPEGTEADAGGSIYLTRPDNFNQLRYFISDALRRHSP